MYLYLTLISLIVFFVIFALKKDLRTQMLWAGILSFPLFALKSLIMPQFLGEITRLDLYFVYLLEAIIFGFTFGGIAAVIFEVLFHKKLKTIPHPHRVHLNWLIFGPIAFLAAELILRLSFGFSIAIGFLVQALILIYLRRDLFWDALISGVFLGLIYIIFYFVFFTILPGNTTGLWFSDVTGISLIGLPIEEILAIFAFGLLWGPLYEGVKDYKLKDSK